MITKATHFNRKILKQRGPNRWFEQERGYGLGNFVMATPTLRYLGREDPVYVYFSDKNIASIYKGCSFIKILEGRPHKIRKPFATTSTAKKYRKKNESDSETLFRIVTGKPFFKMPSTYVDYELTATLDRNKSKKYYVALFHGCLGDIYKERKDIGIDTRQYIINALIRRNWQPVILGTEDDKKTYWRYNTLDGCINFLGKFSLKDSISILKQCDFFISNDTGLYHVAGALNMRGLVLWKDTDCMRNKSPCQLITHVKNKRGSLPAYKKYIDSYLKLLK